MLDNGFFMKFVFLVDALFLFVSFKFCWFNICVNTNIVYGYFNKTSTNTLKFLRYFSSVSVEPKF